jgi:type VI secretion system protein
VDLDAWLQRLSLSRVVSGDTARTLDRIAEVLQLFGSAFVDMRVAHEEALHRFRLGRPRNEPVLHRIEAGRGVIGHLLNLKLDAGDLREELNRALSNFTLHHVASVNALLEGMRDMLSSLAPASLLDADTNQTRAGGRRLLRELWGGSAGELSERFGARYRQLTQGAGFEQELFGPAFARRYNAIVNAVRSRA